MPPDDRPLNEVPRWVPEILKGDEYTLAPKRLNYNITIPANDTALVILQPDVTQPAVLGDEVEVQGYVEINARPAFVSNTYELLLTPEHRGTFFSGSATTPAADIRLIRK